MTHANRWKPYLSVGLLFVPLALLFALLQKMISRPEILDMYMSVTGEEIFAPRALPRLLILGFHEASLGRVSYKYGNYLLQLVSAWGTLAFLFIFARLYLRPLASLAATFLAFLFSLCGFLGLGGHYAYPYDFPIFMLSTVGLWAVVTNRFGVLLVVLFLGTLTKETIVWIVPAFFFFEWFGGRSDPSKRSALAKTCVLGMVFLVTYVVVRMVIRDPASDLVRITGSMAAAGDLRILRNIKELLFLHGRGGVQSVHITLALYVAPIATWNRLPSHLRPLFLAIPFFVVPHLIFSNINELRLFNELLPLGAVGTILVIERFWAE